MDFANLSSFWWALLGLPIVVFYILKIRLRRQPVSTLQFWNQIFEEKRPRSIWQQLRHLVSLLLQLAFLAFLIGALLDPFFSWEQLQARRVVLIVDNSSSMQATDVVPSRLERARQEGRLQIRGLRLRDEMAVVVAGSSPSVACGLTSHQRTLREALASIRPSDSPTRMQPAVQLAERLLADHPRAEILVLSDGCFSDTELATREGLKWIQIGEAADNVGLTQFQVRRSLIDSIGYQVLIEVQNFSRSEVSCRLELELANELVDVHPLTLAAGETWSKVVEHTSAAGGELSARLRDGSNVNSPWHDALPADDAAVALLPQRRKQRVLLVSPGSVYLQQVFAAIPLVEIQQVEQLPNQVPPDTIVVYHRTVPETVPPGRVLVIDPERSTDLWTLGDALQDPLVAQQESDSPLMTHVRLDSDNVLMPEARKLVMNGPHEVLAASINDEVIYCAVQRPAGNVLILTVNLAKGDLPLRTAFPIMMTNAIRWFQGDEGELQQAVASGSTRDVELGNLRQELRAALDTLPDSGNQDTAAPSLRLRAPDGTQRQLPAGVDATTIGPLDLCGLWTIEAGDTEQQRWSASQDSSLPQLQFACNLSNPSESRLEPVALPPTAARADLLGLAGRPIWFYIVLAAVLLSSLEWYLYQRRWIG